MANINIRSPYHIRVATLNLTSAKLELYVYTGTQVSSRGAIKYTIELDAVDDKVIFEISELCRDFLDITFDGEYSSEMVWVDYQITNSISGSPVTPSTIVLLTGFDGYGYFEDSGNPQNDTELMQSNTTIYKYADAPLRIPIHVNSAKTVTFFNDGEEIYSEVFATSALTSSTRISYVSNSDDGIDTYKERVLADSGTFENSECLTDFFGDVDLFPVDKVIIDGDEITVLTIVDIEECKHEPYKVTFVNKFGIKQDLWFFKRTNVGLLTSKESYKGNLELDSLVNYSISEHQNKILNKNGKENLTLNSGFVDESYNEIFRQLMLSEQVWIEYNENTLPIEISSSSLGFKTQLNDKLINYTINCDFAFDKINSVR